MKIIDEKETQKQQQQQQQTNKQIDIQTKKTKTGKIKRGRKFFVKGWEVNDFVVCLC